ncbi:MAG: GPP34 family phosphoprotein [Pseudonocardia sp.]|nr:GPP34 family phosphoprotein [Pseudonocardia sp.]
MQDHTLIVEDVLLLMLDDTTGAPAGAGTLHHTLAGAVLAELALIGRIRLDEDRAWYQGAQVVATGAGPLPDPLLQTTYDAIAARPQDIHTLLATIGFELSEPVTERLVRRGLLRRERKRFLGLFPVTSLPATGTGHESELREQMSGVLEDGGHPDARLAAVIAVISASGTVVLLHPVPRWSDTVATRAKELEQGNWVAVALNIAVTQTTTSSSAAVATVINTAHS